jgi:5-methyltetrahydropteroyltriglutamate--homocysteine methyltransferase
MARNMVGWPAQASRDDPRHRNSAALPYVAADRLIVAPDCGMQYLARDIAFGKLKAMVERSAIVRRELG